MRPCTEKHKNNLRMRL